MPAPRVNVLRWSAGTVDQRIGSQLEFGDTGRLHAVARTSGEQMVAALGPVDAVVDGVRLVPTQVSSEICADEVEQRSRLGDLRLRVRHNLDRTWQLRVQLDNPTDHAVTVDRLGWEVTPGTGARLIVYAAGALATVAFHQVRGPVLGLRLARGDLVVDDEGLACPALVLPPSGSYTVSLQGEWYPSRVAVQAALPSWFPDTEIDQLSADDFAIDHPDAAVVWHGDRTPGVRRVTVADARGTVALDVAVAPEAPDEVARLVLAVAERGMVADAAEAVVLAIGSTLQVDERCVGLLQAYADRTPDEPSPLQVCVWARLATLGWPDMLERALATGDRLRAGPGTGLAAVALWTAVSLEGRELPDLGGRIARLARRAPSAAGPPDPTTAIELGELAGNRDEEFARAQWELELMCHAGPGELWPRRDDAELARAVAVRTLGRDPCTGLVRRLLARCAGRADATRNAVVLAWLGFSGV